MKRALIILIAFAATVQGQISIDTSSGTNVVVNAPLYIQAETPVYYRSTDDAVWSALSSSSIVTTNFFLKTGGEIYGYLYATNGAEFANANATNINTETLNIQDKVYADRWMFEAGAYPIYSGGISYDGMHILDRRYAYEGFGFPPTYIGAYYSMFNDSLRYWYDPAVSNRYQFIVPIEIVDPNTNTILYLSSGGMRVGRHSWHFDAYGNATATDVWMNTSSITTKQLVASETITLGGVERNTWPDGSGAESDPVFSTWLVNNITSNIYMGGAEGAVTNGQTGVTLSGAFSGDGSGLTGLSHYSPTNSSTTNDVVFLHVPNGGTGVITRAAGMHHIIFPLTNSTQSGVFSGFSSDVSAAVLIEFQNTNSLSMPGIDISSLVLSTGSVAAVFMKLFGSMEWTCNPL